MNKLADEITRAVGAIYDPTPIERLAERCEQAEALVGRAAMLWNKLRDFVGPGDAVGPEDRWRCAEMDALLLGSGRARLAEEQRARSWDALLDSEIAAFLRHREGCASSAGMGGQLAPWVGDNATCNCGLVTAVERARGGQG